MMFPDLPEGKFDIIYADPPWDYKGQTQHAGAGSDSTGGATSHYRCVKLNSLVRIPLDNIAAKDCLLFLWATSPHLDQAIELGKSWGFKWATVGFVWDKIRKNPGYYTMSQCELCLIFKKGKIPQPRGSRNIEQLVRELRGTHSTKPDEVAERIDKMFPNQSKVELFSRRTRPGWASWGDGLK